MARSIARSGATTQGSGVVELRLMGATRVIARGVVDARRWWLFDCAPLSAVFKGACLAQLQLQDFRTLPVLAERVVGCKTK